MTLVRRPLSERFWPKVDKGDPGACWDWLGAKSREGYGYLGRIRESGIGPFVPAIRATHAAWLLTHGQPVPAGMCICHRCDRPVCVNPDHLWLGSRAANNADRTRKGRTNDRRGALNSNVKLTPKQVVEIRARYATRKWSQVELASEYGVKQPQISRIVRGENYQL